MLKSTVNSPKSSETKRPTLPHLFKCVPHGHVVLFFTESSGVELVNGHFNRGLHYREDWVSCWDAGVWSPLALGESVTITVESED